MLSNTLNTNEVKNAAATEVEFDHMSFPPGRSRVFKQVPEPPDKPHRLTISHSETGASIKLRRRSLVRFDKTVISDRDGVTPVTVSAYCVLDAPVGALNVSTEIANVLAQLQSFMATTGSGTTVLFDCTGNGAAALLNGSL
jgi:hypothetical protein